MDRQMSIYELMPEEEPEVVLPQPAAGERVYTIPQDVWENRCRICVHKRGEENIPMPKSAVWQYRYEEIIPCRIMGISQPNVMPGECMSFAPAQWAWGLCATCKHDAGTFHEGFCFKEDHAEQHRVCYGTHYGGDDRKRDYWGRHRLSTCDDYEPDEFAKKYRAEGKA